MRGRSLTRHKQHNKHVSHVVHADGSITAQEEETVSYSGTSPKMMRRRLLLIVAVLGISMLALVFVMQRSSEPSKQTAVSSGIVENFAKEAAPYLSESTRDSLKVVAEKISQQDVYQTSPDLLYILVVSDIYNRELDSATSRLAYLKSIFDDEKGYATPEINNTALTLQELDNLLDYSKKQVQESNNNAFGVKVAD